MSQPVKSLLSDLQRVVQRLNDHDNKKEDGPVEREPPAQEPDTARASKPNNADQNKIHEVNKLAIKADGKLAGVGIGVEFGNTIKLERVEVTPEPDGRVRIMLSLKKGRASAAP